MYLSVFPSKGHATMADNVEFHIRHTNFAALSDFNPPSRPSPVTNTDIADFSDAYNGSVKIGVSLGLAALVASQLI